MHFLIQSLALLPYSRNCWWRVVISRLEVGIEISVVGVNLFMIDLISGYSECTLTIAPLAGCLKGKMTNLVDKKRKSVKVEE